MPSPFFWLPEKESKGFELETGRYLIKGDLKVRPIQRVTVLD